MMPVEPPFFEQVEDQGDRHLIGDAADEIGGEALQICGDAPLPDPLRDGAALGLKLALRVVVEERRAVRVDQTHLDAFRLKVGRHPGDCAA